MFQSRLSDIVEPLGIVPTQICGYSPNLKSPAKKSKSCSWVVDLFLIAIASTLGGIVYQHVWFANPATVEACLSVGIIAGLAYVSSVSARGLYRLPVLLAPLPYIGRLLAIFATTAFLVAGSLLFLKGDVWFPVSPLVAALLPQMIFLVIARRVFAKATRALLLAGTLGGRRVVTIGEPAELLGLSANFLLRYCGSREVFRVPLATNCGSRSGEVLAGLDGALAAAREHGAEEFLVALRWGSQELLETIRSRLRELPLPVRLLPDHNIRTLLKQHGLSTGGLSRPVAIQAAPLTTFERAVKRTLDVVGSVTAILFLSPLFLLAAIAVKLDSGGPIIFRQRRTGFQREGVCHLQVPDNDGSRGWPAITQACRDDLRTTRVGKFLRRSSIDELPQLLNVLKGEMSLVGPRPHAVAHDREYKVHIADYGFRHHIKPGITGWAQVNGLRGETRSVAKMNERVKLDLWYINNWSLGFDIAILARTCFEVLRDRAY